MAKIVCIEVTDICTKVCEMDSGKKNPTIYKSLIFENPQYSIDDGFIADRRAYGKELKAQLRSARIPANNLVFTISSNKIVSREILIPEMKEDHVGELISNERQNYFPMDTSDHQFAFLILEHVKASKQMRVLVYAAPSILIQNYRALGIEQNFKISRIDYSGNSIAQWLARPENKDMSMYLQVNERNTVFTIMTKGRFNLQRNMNFGYETCMAEGGTPEAIRPLVTNVASVLEYFSAKNRDADISIITIGGLGAEIPGLAETMENEFNGIRVEIVEKLPGLKIKKKDSDLTYSSTQYIACLGASESSINFYSDNTTKRLSKVILRAAVAFVLVLAASAIIVMNGKDELTAAEKRKSELELKYAQLMGIGIADLESDAIEKVIMLSELEEMDAGTHPHTSDWNSVIAALENSGVKNMVISSVSSAEGGMNFNVTVTSKTEAAKLYMQLKSLECFSDVAMNSISDTGSDKSLNASTVSFAIACAYEGKAVFTDEQTRDEKLIEDLNLNNLNGFDILSGMGVIKQ